MDVQYSDYNIIKTHQAVEGPLESSIAAAAPVVEAGPNVFNDAAPIKAEDTPVAADAAGPGEKEVAPSPSAEDTPLAEGVDAEQKDEAVMLPLAPAGATPSADEEGAMPEKGEGYIVEAEAQMGNPAVKERVVPHAEPAGKPAEAPIVDRKEEDQDGVEQTVIKEVVVETITETPTITVTIDEDAAVEPGETITVTKEIEVEPAEAKKGKIIADAPVVRGED